jgi:hypothetical protein
MGFDMQHGHGCPAWTWSCSIDMYMDISMGKQLLAESTVEELAEVTESW